MADQTEFDDGESVSEEVLRRRARRIVSILSHIAECLDDREIADLNEILLELVEVSKQRDGGTREASKKLYMRFFERVEFRPGISVQLIKQAIRSLRIVQCDVEHLGKIVYNMYREMILRDYPSLVTAMKMNPGLLRGS